MNKKTALLHKSQKITKNTCDKQLWRVIKDIFLFFFCGFLFDYVFIK